MTGNEAPAIAAALAAHAADYPAATLFIYLLILTGARPDEIARAKWSDIRDGAIVLTEHKTDGHADERIIFLPPRAVVSLEMMPETRGTLTGIKSPRWLWEKIRKECGCEDLRLYDLRRTFASAALRAGYSLDQIGELLGHTSGTTTKRYAWLMDESRAEAATATSDVLDGMLKRLPAPSS
jgi:integrase